MKPFLGKPVFEKQEIFSDEENQVREPYLGIAVDGSLLAVGARCNGGTGPDAGHARVYELSGGAWVQVGDDIDGEAAGDQLQLVVNHVAS